MMIKKYFHCLQFLQQILYLLKLMLFKAWVLMNAIFANLLFYGDHYPYLVVCMCNTCKCMLYVYGVVRLLYVVFTSSSCAQWCPGPSSPVHISPHRLSVSPLSVVWPELDVVLGRRNWNAATYEIGLKSR